MDDWVWWMIAAGVLAVGEIFTLSFFLGPIAVAAGRGLGHRRSPAAGPASSGSCSSRCRWRRCSSCARSPAATCRTPARLRTGTAALVGARAEVIERVDGRGGQVKIGGEIWSARTYDEDEVIETGTRVEVMKIDGATALVSE